MIAPVMPTYVRVDLVFERGEGPYLFTTDGERYLDLGCGIAVTSLGHAHPHLVEALKGQAERLWHTSNLYRIDGQERLAERLTAALSHLSGRSALGSKAVVPGGVRQRRLVAAEDRNTSPDPLTGVEQT